MIAHAIKNIAGIAAQNTRNMLKQAAVNTIESASSSAALDESVQRHFSNGARSAPTHAPHSRHDTIRTILTAAIVNSGGRN